MKRTIFFVATVFAGVLVGTGLGGLTSVGEGSVWGALFGAAFGASVALAGLKVGGFELPPRTR